MRGWLLWITDGRANPLMDRKVVEVSSLSLSFPLFLSLFLSLSFSLSFSLFLSLSLSFSDYLPTYLSVYLSIDRSICLSLSLSRSLSLSISLSVCLSVYLSICKFENEAILRDFLRFWTWQHQKRSNSARLPQFLHLTTSKTKQFCETSFLKLTTSKTKQFCETSFKNGKLSAELTAWYQCVLRFFQSTCLNYCACHEKVMPGLIWSAAPVTQNHLPKTEDLMLHNATS